VVRKAARYATLARVRTPGFNIPTPELPSLAKNTRDALGFTERKTALVASPHFARCRHLTSLGAGGALAMVDYR